MSTRIFRTTTKTVMLNDSEHLEVFVAETGVGIEEFLIYSEAFEAWIKQDIGILMRMYPAQYAELCERAYQELDKKGGF